MTATSAPPPEPRKPRALSHSIFDMVIGSGALMAITLVTGILLSRLLGPEGRGIYGSAVFLATFILNVLGFSMYEGAIVHIRKRKMSSEQSLTTMLAISGLLVLAATIVVGAGIALGWIAVDTIEPLHLMAFLVVAIAAGHWAKAFNVADMANLNFAMLNIERAMVPFLLMLCVAMLFILDMPSIKLLLIAFVVSKIILFAPRIWRYRRHFGAKVDGSLIRDAGKLGFRMHLSSGALMLASEADRLVLISIWSPEMLGYYFVAMSACGAALSLAGQAIQVTLLPSLSGLEPHEKRRRIEQLFRLLLLIGLGLVVALWVTAPFLIPLIFGEDFAPAVFYVRAMVIASVLKLMVATLFISHLSEEKTLPGILTAASFLVVFAIGFALTGFVDAERFFIVLALANLASLITSMILLQRDGLMRIGLKLLPMPADIALLTRTFTGYAKSILRRAA